MSIRNKLSLSLCFLGLALLAMAASGYWALQTSSEKTRTIIADRVIPLQHLKVVADGYAVNVVDAVHKIRAGTLSWSEGKSTIADALDVIKSEWSGYAVTAMVAQEQTIAERVTSLMDGAAPGMERLTAIVQAQDMAALAGFADAELYPLVDPISENISALIDLQGTVAQEEFAAAMDAERLSYVAMSGIGILSLLALSFALWVVTKGVTGPLQGLQHAMLALSQGKLDQEVPFVGRRDEIGGMAGAVEVFKQNAIQIAAMGQLDAERAAQAAKRAQMMNEFQKAFSKAIESCVKGDFSARVDQHFGENEIDQITTNFNSMLESTNAALQEAGQVLSAMARTDLTQRMEGVYHGAFAALMQDTNAVSDKLAELITQLRGTSSSLKVATSEILAGADDLAERTTKQAAAIEQTSAVMEQLAGTVVENAKKAEDAASGTAAATELAQQSGTIMNEANNAMERITASSGKISSIIDMIDDIAFQTNLLALNASVEAARAGEAGKGFAVVAIEVRRLAQSAAHASLEIKQLIEQSAREVNDGSKLVATAAQKLQAIVESVHANNKLIDAIARASNEQSSAIAQVTVAVREMDEMTQHNAALVQQTNAAIEQTDSRAEELDRIVAVFRIKEAGSKAAPAPIARQRTGGGLLRAV